MCLSGTDTVTTEFESTRPAVRFLRDTRYQSYYFSCLRDRDRHMHTRIHVHMHTHTQYP